MARSLRLTILDFFLKRYGDCEKPSKVDPHQIIQVFRLFFHFILPQPVNKVEVQNRNI